MKRSFIVAETQSTSDSRFKAKPSSKLPGSPERSHEVPSRGGKQRKDETDSEEERWLDAIEEGKLEQMDDELRKIKNPTLMTARQRALLDKRNGGEDSYECEPLMSLSLGYKDKGQMTEEMQERHRKKTEKRREQAKRQREEEKKKIVTRLLKKAESRLVRDQQKSRQHAPMITYRQNSDLTTISLPANVAFPLENQVSSPPTVRLCSVEGCKNIRKYSCSKTGVSLCSIGCYKSNLEANG